MNDAPKDLAFGAPRRASLSITHRRATREANARFEQGDGRQGDRIFVWRRSSASARSRSSVGRTQIQISLPASPPPCSILLASTLRRLVIVLGRTASQSQIA